MLILLRRWETTRGGTGRDASVETSAHAKDFVVVGLSAPQIEHLRK